MRIIFCLIFSLFLFCSTKNQIEAQDFHSMYDSNTLRYRQERSGENIRLIYEEELRDFVPGNLQIDIATPLLPSQGISAFNFYASGNQVIIPISALLFMDQIITAFVWLNYHGYSTQTIFDYLGMLKYQSFEQCPLPWPTLGIPENVYDDDYVNTMSMELTKTALLWIIAHEVGHIYHRHPKSTIANEIEADEFANKKFREMGYVPKGIVYFFAFYTSLMPHRGDFYSNQAWTEFNQIKKTHPFNGDRLIRLGEEFKINPTDFTRYAHGDIATLNGLKSISNEIIALGNLLNDKNIQRYMTFRSAFIRPEYLHPHSGKNEQWLPKKKNQTNYTTDDYNGDYEGITEHFYGNNKKEIFKMQLNMHRIENKISGNFNFGMGVGIYTGTLIPNNKAMIRWQLGDAKGSGIIQLAPATSKFNLEAIWGYNKSTDDGGTWKLIRK